VIRAIWWKELREQWLVGVTLVALGVGAASSVTAFVKPRPEDGLQYALAGLFAWLIGLIVGAQLLAGEWEAGTQGWLDTLPVSRRQVWRAKVAMGIVFVAALTSLLARCLALTQPPESWVRIEPGGLFIVDHDFRAILFWMMCCAASGYGCGVFGSALARTPLGAVGLAIVIQPFVAIAALIATTPQVYRDLVLMAQAPAVYHINFATEHQVYFVLQEPLALGLMTLAIWGLTLYPASRVYTRPDRRRQRVARAVPDAGRSPVRVVFWLAWRQGQAVYWAVLLAGLAAALFLRTRSPVYWPLLGTALGVATGLMAFAPDQGGDAYRLLGDRRVPPGRVWLVKVGLAVALLTVFVGSLVVIMAAHDRATYAWDRSADTYWLRLRVGMLDLSLRLGPIYGLALGQFFGMTCRKRVVASALAVVTSAVVVTAWLPFGTVEILPAWLWLGPPVVLLVATRLAMRPWVAGRLGTLRPAAGMVLAALLAAAGVAGGLMYRSIETGVVPFTFWAH
jgi:hypothetical protein